MQRFKGAKRRSSPEDKKRRQDDKAKSDDMVHFDRFLQIEAGEETENHQGNDLLHRLELRCRELVTADPVGRNLQAVFKKSDSPADQDSQH